MTRQPLIILAGSVTCLPGCLCDGTTTRHGHSTILLSRRPSFEHQPSLNHR